MSLTNAVPRKVNGEAKGGFADRSEAISGLGGGAPKDNRKLALAASIPFFAVHALALGVFLLPFRWYYPVVALGLYYFRMAAITIGYHRYFSHRAFKTSRFVQFLMAFFATTSTQKGVLWWAAHHRDHHKYSDLEGDIHSPLRDGFWWSHWGWILAHKYDETKFDRIQDFAKYPELRWLNKWHVVPAIIMGVTLFLIGGWPLLFWGYFVSTTVLWHCTFTINSLAHVWGSRRYKTTDDSRNNFWLALITCGEGWHNNHHFYQSTANQGFFWWEVDVSYYIIRALAAVGLVWDVRTPPKHVRDAYKQPELAPAEAPAPVVATAAIVAPPV
jgi:stearoyl-CoA desaturase (delta-9 desaturase)